MADEVSVFMIFMSFIKFPNQFLLSVIYPVFSVFHMTIYLYVERTVGERGRAGHGGSRENKNEKESVRVHMRVHMPVHKACIWNMLVLTLVIQNSIFLASEA